MIRSGFNHASAGRPALVVLACVLSVGLIGAVRARTVEPARSTAAGAPKATVAASMMQQPVDVALVTTAAPAVTELLQNVRPAAPVAIPVAPTPAARVIRMEVTAYCACKKCCGPGAMGLTASGKTVKYNGGRFVAADTKVLPFSTKLQVPGYASGQPVEVIDRGGAIKGNKLDLFFATHEAALKWGRQWVDVTVVE